MGRVYRVRFCMKGLLDSIAGRRPDYLMPVNRWLDDKWFRQLTGEMVERADMNVAFSLPDTNGQLLGGPVANSLLTERWRALQDFEPPTSWFVARTSLEELPISRSACWRIRTTRAGKRARG